MTRTQNSYSMRNGTAMVAAAGAGVVVEVEPGAREM